MPIGSGSELGGNTLGYPKQGGVSPGLWGWKTSVLLRQQGFEPEASVLLSVVPVPLLQEALVFIPEEDE